MKNIKVSNLTYNDLSGIGTINILDDSGAISKLSIDLKTLLPFSNFVNEDVFDFFRISASVYGIDRFVSRKRNSIDGWSRELNINLPVNNPSKWNNNIDRINSILSFLTGDYWSVQFRKEIFECPQTIFDEDYSIPFEQVNLLSGGLDSLIGALDFLEQNPSKNILFVSHYDSQMHGPKSDQKDIIMGINKVYKGNFMTIPSVKVSLESTDAHRETTFRSRSLLFIGIALVAAQATNTKNIIIPENGTVSLNYPLSASRRSSCSTKTTHPFVIENILSLWENFSITTDIQNPYEFQTKGEMINACKDKNSLYKLLPISNSCGKRGHRSHWQVLGASHCGICMPCIYRQAALLNIIDETTYGNTINSLPPFLSKKSQDVGACLDYLCEPITKEDIKQELIINGVKNLKKINQYVEVVWRTREELKQWVIKVGNSTVRSKAGV